MLKAVNIEKSLGGAKVLKGIDLFIEKGKVTVLVGPSGAGKTTIFRAISLVDIPDRGVIEIDSQRFEFPLAPAARQPALWPQITLVFQQGWLWPHLTLKRNVWLPCENKRSEEKRDYFEKLVDLFRLEHLLNRYPNQLSQGERQRGALVRALLLEPKYLLVDEATSALDVEIIQRFLGHLESLRDKGVGIGIITHMLGIAERFADENRILFVEDGRITPVEPGSGSGDLHQQRAKTFLSLVSLQ